MLSKACKYKIILRVVSVLIIHALILSDVAFGLAPASRFKPLVKLDPTKGPVVFYYISILIGRYFYLGVSHHTLIPDIKKHVSNAELARANASGPLLAGFKVDEITPGEEENTYIVPIYRNGKKAFGYKYYIEKKPAPQGTPAKFFEVIYEQFRDREHTLKEIRETEAIDVAESTAERDTNRLASAGLIEKKEKGIALL